MNTYEYCMQMVVPLGIREGWMIIYEKNGRLEGTLELFENCEPFIGFIQDDGSCILHGKIVTYTKTLIYRAFGKMCKESIELDLYDHHDKYCLKGKGIVNEKVL